jgi:tetratricopeptide (TPR) repeat protein
MAEKTANRDVIRRHLEYLKFYPKSVEAHYNLGLAYVQAGETDKALEAFQKAIELRPDLIEAYINMGGVYFQQGKLEESIRANQQALELRPDALQAHSNLAFAYLQKADWEAAIEAAERALEIDPALPVAYYHLAIANHHLGRDSEALLHLDKAGELGFQVDKAFRKEVESRAAAERTS